MTTDGGVRVVWIRPDGDPYPGVSVDVTLRVEGLGSTDLSAGPGAQQLRNRDGG
ncbi:MAG: hypothetical protein V5A62_17550 [Haloarculaceae archaeon]